MTTFVLVHGAWHGGWCWKRVAKHLRSQGHEVHTPSLSGLAERSHLMTRLVNLETHILDIVNLFRWEELSEVVLCGHSYGGMVITGAADRVSDRVRSLVYLDAFLPENGQSLLDTTIPDRRSMLIDRASHDPYGRLMTPIPAAVFKVNAADQAWVDSLCVPHPLACFEQKLVLSGTAAKLAKHTYIEAAGYSPSPFGPLAERLRKDKSWMVTSLPCGHDAMVDMPKEVAELLIAAV